MRIRTSSSVPGFIVGLLVSLFSFIAIHIGFIVTHELVNNATPKHSIAYTIDRKMESLELLIARIRSKEVRIEVQTHLANERIEELEKILVDTSSNDQQNQYLAMLLDDTYRSMEAATSIVESYVDKERSNIHMFTVALLVESTADDITRRLINMEEHAVETQKQSIATITQKIEKLLQRSIAITTRFDVEQSVAESIRTTIQQEIAARKLQNNDGAQHACGSKNTTCETTRDCCGNLGLTCSPVTLSSGVKSKRCLEDTVLLCRITCESGTWKEPRACRMAAAPQDTPRCTDIAGKECTETVGDCLQT